MTFATLLAARSATYSASAGSPLMRAEMRRVARASRRFVVDSGRPIAVAISASSIFSM